MLVSLNIETTTIIFKLDAFNAIHSETRHTPLYVLEDFDCVHNDIIHQTSYCNKGGKAHVDFVECYASTSKTVNALVNGDTSYKLQAVVTNESMKMNNHIFY